jgi:hypothetical protein
MFCLSFLKFNPAVYNFPCRQLFAPDGLSLAGAVQKAPMEKPDSRVMQVWLFSNRFVNGGAQDDI